MKYEIEAVRITIEKAVLKKLPMTLVESYGRHYAAKERKHAPKHPSWLYDVDAYDRASDRACMAQMELVRRCA